MREDAALMASLAARSAGAHRTGRPAEDPRDGDTGRWFRPGH
jgi:hypothetical protein